MDTRKSQAPYTELYQYYHEIISEAAQSPYSIATGYFGGSCK